MQAHARRVNGRYHLQYSLPQQIHCASLYPLPAPNGSRIILLGNAQGLRVLWRGGRPFKAGGSNRPQAGNTTDDDVMIIDGSDDHDSPEPKDNDDWPFEDELPDVDPARAYDDILQTLDLPLGSAVMSLAVHRLPHAASPDRYPLTPSIWAERMVLAVTCADRSIRVLTLPLAPPTPATFNRKSLREDPAHAAAGRGCWDETLVTFTGNQTHQSLPRGLSIALTPRSALQDDERAPTDDHSFQDDEEGWDILIASHSAELGGRMLVHRIPLNADGDDVEHAGDVWCDETLPNAAMNVELHAPTSVADLTAPRVLVAERSGAVRLYQCTPKDRFGNGLWLVTLQAGNASSPDSTSQTREIVAAQWVLNGQGILVLLADGEWGMWYLKPSKASRAALNGSVPTRFALSGWIAPSSTDARIISSVASHSIGDTGRTARLAPMTPSTRRVRENSLFQGPTKSTAPNTTADPAPSSSTIRTAPHSSGLSVQRLDPSVTGYDHDESVIMWHAGRAELVPSLRAYWTQKVGGESTQVGKGGSAQLRNVSTSLSLLPVGDRCIAIAALPSVSSPEGYGKARNSVLIPDMLVFGERNLGILAAPAHPRRLGTPLKHDQPARSSSKPPLNGEMDIDDLDAALDSMAQTDVLRSRGLLASSSSRLDGPSRRAIGSRA